MLWGAGALCAVVLHLTSDRLDESARVLISNSMWSVIGVGVAALAIYDLRNAKLDDERRSAWRSAAAALLFSGFVVRRWFADSGSSDWITALAWTHFGLLLAAWVVRDLRKARPRY